MFSLILNQYDQAQSSNISTFALVHAAVEKSSLPVVFKEDTSVELISRMAEQLVSLVQIYDLSNHTEPVKELDRVHPKWRDSFPFRLMMIRGPVSLMDFYEQLLLNPNLAFKKIEQPYVSSYGQRIILKLYSQLFLFQKS